MIASLVTGLAKPLTDLVDNLFTSDEERAAAKVKLLELEQSGKLQEIQAQMSAILAEANSEDPWTSRARPTFLYLFYAVIGSCFVMAFAGGILSIWWPEEVTTAAQAMANLLSATLGSIPDWMFGAFTAGYLGYAGFRSWDKRAVRK
ncbi:MAG: 3TM-type holin [Rhodospirillaceae bacterium]